MGKSKRRICGRAIYISNKDFRGKSRERNPLKAVLSGRSDFAAVLGEAREFVAPGLDRVHRIMETVAHGAPGKLSGHLQDLLQRRGKRVRSTFLLLFSQCAGSADAERAARVCAAVELVHLASLIHDDIIDGSDLRRDEKTAHQRWGNRVAVLLGDYALAKAMEMVWSDPDARIPLSICRASSRLIRAEIQEVERAGKTDLTVEGYFEIIEGKTAALFEACGECGALLAGLDERGERHGAALGRGFGVAFQIVDDMLDFGVNVDGLGKRTFSDVKNGFLTLPMILFYKVCSPEAREEMQALLKDPLPAANQMRIREMLEEHEALRKARDMATGQALAGLPFLESLRETPASMHLRQVCALMTHRTD